MFSHKPQFNFESFDLLDVRCMYSQVALIICLGVQNITMMKNKNVSTTGIVTWLHINVVNKTSTRLDYNTTLKLAEKMMHVSCKSLDQVVTVWIVTV